MRYDFLYVNLRPSSGCIDIALRTGELKLAGVRLDVEAEEFKARLFAACTF